MFGDMLAMGAGGGTPAVTPTQRILINNTTAESSSYTPDKDVLAMLIYSGYNGSFSLYEDGTQVLNGTTNTSTDGYRWKMSTYQLTAGKAYTIKAVSYQYTDTRFGLYTLDLG